MAIQSAIHLLMGNAQLTHPVNKFALYTSNIIVLYLHCITKSAAKVYSTYTYNDIPRTQLGLLVCVCSFTIGLHNGRTYSHIYYLCSPHNEDVHVRL
jgi:hypothetical protein